MPSIATPLFAGDLYDTALRLARTLKLPPPLGEGGGGSRPPQEPSDAWRQMLDLGWQGVLVPEEYGGAGAELADFAAIVEGVATQALPVPLIDRCAIAPALLAAAAQHPAARTLLERCASGEASIAAVLHAAPQQQAARPPVLAADGRPSGTVLGADWSEPATHVVFDARTADGSPVLVLLDASKLASRLRRYVGIDSRITTDIDLDGLAAGDVQAILRGEAAARAIDAAQQLGSLLGCVRTVAACGAMIEQTIDYLNTRVQFGVALSTFQALRHRVVEMYVAYENARGLVREQVLHHAQSPDAKQVALARLYVQGNGRTIAESAIQLHGGMGMSQETLAARLAMHVLMSALQFGDKSNCLDWLAAGMAAEQAGTARAA